MFNESLGLYIIGTQCFDILLGSPMFATFVEKLSARGTRGIGAPRPGVGVMPCVLCQMQVWTRKSGVRD